MTYLFIKSNEDYYLQAIQLRIELFFQEFINAFELINDSFEHTGIHIVCLDNDFVIGTGRLNIIDKKGIISQMAIDNDYQKRGIGKEILSQLINLCKEQKINTIELSARETALKFYDKFNFKPTGNLFPSEKTGVIHQEMVLNL